MLNYFTVNTITEIVCFLVSAICISKTEAISWQGIRVLLLITCLTELTGIYLKLHHQSNQWAYNILLIFQMVFISIFFAGLFNYRKSKLAIAGGFALLVIVYIYEINTHGVMLFNSLCYNTMYVLYVIYSLCFFVVLLRDDAYIDLKFSAGFWWVAGTLLFGFGCTAVNLFRGKLSIMVTPKHYLTYYIYIVLNVLLYTCWSYSFICKRLMPTSKK